MASGIVINGDRNQIVGNLTNLNFGWGLYIATGSFNLVSRNTVSGNGGGGCGGGTNVGGNYCDTGTGTFTQGDNVANATQF